MSNRSNLIPVMVQWNYWRNGNFQGRCEGVEINDQLTLHNFDVPCKLGKNAIVFGWRVFPIHGHREWVGNWCWDMVWMTPETAKKLIRYLAYLDADPESGETEAFEKFEAMKEAEKVAVTK